jgi:hypothetical protein
MAGFPSLKKGTQIGEKAKRPKPGIPLDKKIVEKLIVEHGGNISRVADCMGSCRGVIRGIVDRDPHLQDVLKQARERQLDELEQSCFDRAMSSSDTTLQLFLLKTQGKSRGYDQNESLHAAKDVATAAFDFILSKHKKS